MSGALRRFGIAAVVVLVVSTSALAIFSLVQPTSYRIVRSRVIAASPDRIFAQLTDLRAYEAWDPWPALPGETPVVTFSTISSGLGAWVERREPRGSSRTTIRSIDAERVILSTQTAGPLGGNVSTQTFALRPVSTGTEVTWTFGADLRGLARALYPFVHLEENVGPEMERALTRLERAATR